MYKPQTEPIQTLAIEGPNISYPIISFFRLFMQPFARSIHFREPVMLHGERMVNAYHAFQEKKIRLIFGFRHAYGDDPQLMVYVLHHALQKAARKAGSPITGITHAHFIYGTEVPLWSGSFVRWLLPKVGAVPVNHLHMNSEGMNRIRRTTVDGEFPLALAPEGHVTHDSERIGELETGTARFGFWCIEDLAKQNRDEQVVFLPVSFHYRYGKNAEKKLSVFISGMESELGIDTLSAGKKTGWNIPERLKKIGLAILSHMAVFYGELEEKPVNNDQADILESSLAACERIFNLQREGDSVMRIYRIRNAGWVKIFRGDTEGMTPLRRELSCRETGEAWYAMRHMETAEMLVHVDFTDIPDNAETNRYFEIANNFYDCIERLKGGTLRNRANIFDKEPVVVPGEPIVMNEYFGLYKTDKKAALQKATADMQTAFEECIKEYHNEYR